MTRLIADVVMCEQAKNVCVYIYIFLYIYIYISTYISTDSKQPIAVVAKIHNKVAGEGKKTVTEN